MGAKTSTAQKMKESGIFLQFGKLSTASILHATKPQILSDARAKVDRLVDIQIMTTNSLDIVKNEIGHHSIANFEH